MPLQTGNHGRRCVQSSLRTPRRDGGRVGRDRRPDRDQALRVGAIGLGASTALVAAAVLLVFAGGITRLEPRLLASVAALFAAWLSVRASPWLLVPDIAASLLLLGLAASLAVRGSLLDIGAAESVGRAFNAALHGIAGVVFVGRPIASTRSRLGVMAPVARGILIAIPIAACWPPCSRLRIRSLRRS